MLLQLEAEGRLSLDDTVDKWLPGLVRGNGHDGRGITLRQLLNHTSGIFNYTADEQFGRTYFLKDGFFEHRYDTTGARGTGRDRHDPQAGLRAGHVLELLQHQLRPGRHGDREGHGHVRTATRSAHRIIKPLGLRRHVGPGHPSDGPAAAAAAPTPSWRETATGPTYDVTELNPSLAYAAGEMISDSADLNRFYTALLQRQAPAAEAARRDEDHGQAVDGIPNAGYGLGLMERELSCGVTVWGHGGGIHGSISEAVTTADGRHSLAFNFNSDWAGDTEAIVEAEFCGK